ncbi:MAG: hypothetical protein J6S56_04705 [Bacteroidales bacterium]|nr:hypothetical protein [Bacteroidales bacterium]
MNKRGIIIILTIVVSMLVLSVTCIRRTDSPSEFSKGGKSIFHTSQIKDTLHTKQAAMSIYAYQPIQALQIIDTAVLVGNLSEWAADMYRAKIFSSTLMKDQLDSLLQGPKGACLDTARTISKRLLGHDSVKVDLKRLLDVWELLINIARMQDDTSQWLQCSYQFVDVCHQIGAEEETNALRTEAEIGAALCSFGQKDKGLAKLDSVIEQLSGIPSFTFAELDALIVALKRKIHVLASDDQYAETSPG